MEQIKHDTVAGGCVNLYRSPEARVTFVKAQGVLCVSNPEKYSTEMNEGNDNW